jgi:hypothetical protein
MASKKSLNHREHTVAQGKPYHKSSAISASNIFPLSRINPETNNRIYFHGLIPSKCRTEFPAVQSDQNL